jgi:hypothetical protein
MGLRGDYHIEFAVSALRYAPMQARSVGTMKMLDITSEKGPGLLHSLFQVKPRDHSGAHEPT